MARSWGAADKQYWTQLTRSPEEFVSLLASLYFGKDDVSADAQKLIVVYTMEWPNCWRLLSLEQLLEINEYIEWAFAQTGARVQTIRDEKVQAPKARVA